MTILGLSLNGKPAGEVALRPSIQLDRAVLCGNCDSIFEAERDQRCPACGSEQGMSLGRALNREKEQEAPA